MDESNVHFGRGPGSDNVLPPCLDPKQIFFTNLQLLGFDTAAMEMKYKIPFNKEMFNLPNKTGAEVVLHFLFNRLNATMSQQQFRDCWPVTDKKSEAAFRKVCCIWLQNIQKEEADARLPRINASLFLSPGGDKFCHLLFAFSTYVILHVIRKEHGVKDSGLLGYPMLTSQNKDLGFVMETTVNCAAIRHRKSFFETLGQTASAKQRWQSHGDELIKSLRGQIKEMREMEREKRDQIQLAAHKGLDRGSPIPASRRSQDFDMSTHMARRAQRVQQVRGLWKDIEGYLERSQEEQDIVSSVLDKTQEKYSLDAANIQISIPHLMLRECEQEMRRRQVDNIYEGGELNLMSILQLWNLALRMYIQRLQKDGLKDLSDEANNMRSQAHTHQAYLANTSLLREKMAREIPHRKKTVARLRNQFRSEVTTSGLAMAAPSPPVTFDPPRGHSGATPTGPVVQMSPDQETPEAAVDIANFISRTSRKTQMESFQTRAFGLSSNQNRNQNNSMRLPKPAPSSGAGGSSVGRQQPKSSQSRRGRGDIQPRVVRHISRQPAAPPASSHKMSAPGKDRAQVSSRQHLASTPEKISRTQCADLDKTPVPADHNNSAAETARDRAHNILADKIVWSVMHGEEGFSELSHDLGLTSPRTSPTSVPMASASARAKGSPTSLHSHTLADSQHKTKASSHRRADKSAVSDSDCVGSPFVRTVSPVTLVQQAHMSDADNGSDGVSQGSIKDVHTERKRTEGDGEEPEAEDINIENPIAALNEGVFASHDMIHRSPLAVDISRMWQDAISDDAEHKDSSSDRNGATGWLDTNRSNASTARTLTPRARWSSSSSEGTASSPPPQQDTRRMDRTGLQSWTSGHHSLLALRWRCLLRCLKGGLSTACHRPGSTKR
ncbi:uncharacterized protein LOC143297353 isoform X2 [Babylonia areolata]|uniref:uncharacterized protein LOC143297353 isoform X2 n=1 Tax=Babylonia areolata TaxID=304850 RepID=UPI003FD0645E